MSPTAISWTKETWNPVAGCTRVSAGCDNCYAAALAAGRLKNTPAHQGLAVRTASGRAAFNGTIRLLPERLDQPLHWRQPKLIFANSMTDLFHEQVPDEFIDQVFAVMAQTLRHTYQVLTKRPGRMRDYCQARILGLPLPNVWLGVSCENQRTAEERIPHLLRTPAAVRFISAEPLLGPVDVRPYLSRLPGLLVCPHCGFATNRFSLCPNDNAHLVPDYGLDWVIAGGESGPGYREMDVEWARVLRLNCAAAGVPFFMKQDSGPRPGKQGRIPAELWVQEFPQAREAAPA